MAEIIFNPPPENNSTSESVLRSQIDSLQTTLASLNQQIIILREALQERDQEIAELEMQLSQVNQEPPKTDNTLTIVGALIKLYKFAFPPQSNVAG